MLPSFCSETVRVLRAPLVDRRGVLTRDWSAVSGRYQPGCMVSLGSTSTAFEGDRELAVSESATLYAPPGADIAPGDRVVCRAGSFEVDGAPQEFDLPDVSIGHLRARLSRWEG